MSEPEHQAPSVGQTGGLPGANAHPATGQISEDDMADTVSMGGSAAGGGERGDQGVTSTNG